MPLLSGVCKSQTLALSSSSYPSIALLLFQPLVIPKLLFMQMTFLLFSPLSQQDFSTYNLILCHEYYMHIHTVYQIQCTVNWFNIQFSLQGTSVELRSLLSQHSLLHKNHRAFSLRVMASSFMFQKAVYQQEYQKQSWKYKSVCPVSSKCLPTVSYWVHGSVLGV